MQHEKAILAARPKNSSSSLGRKTYVQDITVSTRSHRERHTREIQPHYDNGLENSDVRVDPQILKVPVHSHKNDTSEEEKSKAASQYYLETAKFTVIHNLVILYPPRLLDALSVTQWISCALLMKPSSLTKTTASRSCHGPPTQCTGPMRGLPIGSGQ